MKAKTYSCKNFSNCDHKNLCRSMCKKCTYCKEDFRNVEFDASETISFKDK